MTNKFKKIRKSLGKSRLDVILLTLINGSRLSRLEKETHMPKLVRDCYKLCVVYDKTLEDFFPEETQEIRKIIEERQQMMVHKWR
ncbi:hypothetical protein [Candidatus Uabimicrobium sp. HlEnr_7]|uniref:hypothetical protein n=1 Tax=Candidatus Uabimicrobium helgolandensis TaxID=3095367 RepID=UPI003556DB5B